MAETPPPADTGAKPWYDGKLDAELIGHMQNRGWHDKTPDVVAIEAVKAHREVEKFTGVPADRLLKLPKDMTVADEMKPIWQKLGAPADAKEYDLTAVKDASLAEAIRAAAAKAMLPKGAVAEVAKAVQEQLESASKKGDAEKAVALEADRNALKKDWGKNADANMLIAKAAAAKFGIKPEVVAALENAAGYSAVMNMFLAIGQKTGEDKFFGTNSGENSGVMSREQAVARKAELMKDTAWTSAYLAGDAEKGREMLALNRLITGVTE